MRRSLLASRTSRRGPGGWTEPTLLRAATFINAAADQKKEETSQKTQKTFDASSTASPSSSPSFSSSSCHYNSAAVRRAFGVDDFSLIKREQMTLTKLLRIAADATFKPKDPDSKIYGGDGATQKAALREELKTMDHRITPFAHEELLNDYLKNIMAFTGPSGQMFDRECLRGRLVGLLFFTESERSLAFMQILKHFHDRHKQDFVVIAISLGGKELINVTRQFGFFHCTHLHGASWVKRDVGLMIRPFLPLPRLIVVDGTNGEEITRSGLTAVVTHPLTCFDAWRCGEAGHEWWDFLKTFYL